ncbi:hypothetical protein PILCRDRAFT_742909 [Piloderma croceum F 1598]|uniref:UbiA prenyltransferase n=1 Tax=Piloderma croceum (strain F 1598) TaxID=765440 RepID=A0A0C3EWA9_PILCF|nr:hypothetical protein PILCRDRAFT_742909 [Piloderma croceum F 1598]
MNSVQYHIKTLMLFTKSDIKTVVIPVTTFAIAAAPLGSLWRLPHVVFWIWLHLLQTNVANQIIDPEEDACNKSDRPIPAARLTLYQAQIFRWLLVPVCLAVSVVYGPPVTVASAMLCTFTYIYNELGLATHWITKNVLNALGFACFELGATLVAGKHSVLDSVAQLSIACSAGVLATTIQAQDFKDCEGDFLVGRRTLPILYPEISRYTALPILLAWSIGLSLMWQVDVGLCVLFVLLSLLIGWRLIAKRDVPADQITFYIYNVWLSTVHALPGYWRIFRT